MDKLYVSITNLIITFLALFFSSNMDEDFLRLKKIMKNFVV